MHGEMWMMGSGVVDLHTQRGVRVGCRLVKFAAGAHDGAQLYRLQV